MSSLYFTIINNLYISGKFKCPFCSYQTKNRALGRMHVRIHTKEKPFQCSVCNKKFSQKAGLCLELFSLKFTYIKIYIHKKEQHFQCSICNKKFSKKAGL